MKKSIVVVALLSSALVSVSAVLGQQVTYYERGTDNVWSPIKAPPKNRAQCKSGCMFYDRGTWRCAGEKDVASEDDQRPMACADNTLRNILLMRR